MSHSGNMPTFISSDDCFVPHVRQRALKRLFNWVQFPTAVYIKSESVNHMAHLGKYAWLSSTLRIRIGKEGDLSYSEHGCWCQSGCTAVFHQLPINRDFRAQLSLGFTVPERKHHTGAAMWRKILC